MGPRGKQVKFRRGNKQNTRKPKSKTNARKQYSLYQNQNRSKTSDSKENRKRQFNSRKHNLNSDTKRQKREPTLPKVEEIPSESDDDIEDHMKQLRATFGGTDKKSIAIESSDDTGSELEDDISKPELEDSLSDDLFESDEVKNEEDVEDIIEEIDQGKQKDENNTNSNDPFVKHLFYEINDSLQSSLQQVPIVLETHIQNWPRLGKLVIQIPHCVESTPAESVERSIAERKVFAAGGKVPERIHTHKQSLNDVCVKPQICNNLVRANKCLTDSEKGESIPLTVLQSEMFSVINNYQDFYYSERVFEHSEEIRFVYCLHAVNHILKTRTKVLHHNARLSKKDDVPEDFRDQGLTRPKILILVPFKDSAYKIIQMLIDILITEDKGNVINKNRFVEDYTGNELVLPKKNPKPEDYEHTFCGNTNDDFKIGITVTKKSLKLYADFYSSDIIIASPLGLRTRLGAEGEADRDYDFLASIELLIFDQTDLFAMQNWDHVLHVLNHIHLQPKESHGTNFSRVRTWSLNGWAKYYRQTLIFSSVVLPEINSIFNKKCHNYAGKVKTANPILSGSIVQVYVQLPHVFQKFSANSPEDAIEARFNFFVNKILPLQKDSLMKQTLIYVSSYFDYVRIRNYFKREDIGFVQICEYSKDAKVARARDMFFHGDAHFLLYTERHHFYNRIRIKGVRHIVFYQPPNFPHFYYEICNLMQEGNMNKKFGSMSNMTVTVLYSKYDVHQLAAIVNTERAVKMIQSERNVHMLVTGGD